MVVGVGSIGGNLPGDLEVIEAGAALLCREADFALGEIREGVGKLGNPGIILEVLQGNGVRVDGYLDVVVYQLLNRFGEDGTLGRTSLT